MCGQSSSQIGNGKIKKNKINKLEFGRVRQNNQPQYKAIACNLVWASRTVEECQSGVGCLTAHKDSAI